MKKTLFAALALAFVASCSNEEVVEMAQKEAIGFDNAFVNNSTRSVNDPSITTDGANGTTSLANFAVFGFVEGANLFDGIKVAKDQTINSELNSEWQYVGTQYWIAGANYNFYAVAPATDGNWAKSEATKDGLKLTFTNDGTKDVLYAKKDQMGLVSDNEEVKFDFNHILSKVKFSFQNDYNATNATIAVREIKITNAHKTGTVTLNSSINWIEYTTRELELDFGNATDDESTGNKENNNVAYKYGSTYESQNERLVIPTVAETEYDVEFVLDLYIDEELVITYNHNAKVKFQPVAGNSYDIKAVINATNIDPDNEQEPIKFTVTNIAGWGQTNNVDGEDVTIENGTTTQP